MEPDPVLITLGVSVRASRLQVAQQRLLSYGLLAAKKLILLLLEEEGTEHLEIICLLIKEFIINNKLREFDKIWHPLISYLKKCILHVI